MAKKMLFALLLVASVAGAAVATTDDCSSCGGCQTKCCVKK